MGLRSLAWIHGAVGSIGDGRQTGSCLLLSRMVFGLGTEN